MPSWFVKYPPRVGVVSSTVRKALSAMSGDMPQFGPMQLTTKPFSAQMGGHLPTSGIVGSEIKKISVSFSKEYLTGAIDSTLKKMASSFIGEIPLSGDIFSQLKPLIMFSATGSQTYEGLLSAAIQKVSSASLIASQVQNGSVVSSMSKIGASMSGGQTQSGVASMASKTVNANASGQVPMISFVSSAYAPGDTVAMPADIQTGDMIIVFVSRTGSATPALQSGWTNIINANRAVGTGNWSARVAYKVATSSSETVGVWPTTEEIIVHVYRNVVSVGVSQGQSGAAKKTVSWPAATLQSLNGKSWVVRFGHGGGAASLTSDLLTNPISGYNYRSGSNVAVGMDSDGPVSANPVVQTQVTLDTNYWYTTTIELKA